MVAMPVTPAVIAVTIDIALVFLAPVTLVSMISVAIVVLSVPLMLLVVPGLVMMPIITVVAVMGLQELFLLARRKGIAPLMVLLPAVTTAVIVGHRRSRSHQEGRYQASDQQSFHDDSPVLFRDGSCIRTQCRMPLKPDYRTGRECQCPGAGFAGSLRNARSA
tara:strand:- start:892 stop:1380 length:489 start_codon:yes stop_codon:yes gene_type:complete